jgi:hypothetical protein
MIANYGLLSAMTAERERTLRVRAEAARQVREAGWSERRAGSVPRTLRRWAVRWAGTGRAALAGDGFGVISTAPTDS